MPPNYDLARDIRKGSKRSWVNLHAAALLLQGKDHPPFGEPTVEASSISVVRRIVREAGLTLGQIEEWAERKGR